MKKYVHILLRVCLIGIVITGCQKDEEYIITIRNSPSTGGNVTTTPSMNIYPAGTSVTLTADPSSGYEFNKWEGDVTGTSNPAKITMNANKDITAVFTQSNYTLTIQNSPADGGSVTKVPNQDQYTSGTTVTLTANPNSDYEFSKWEGDVAGTTNPITVTMDANKNLTAVYTVVENPVISLSRTNLTFTATQGGSDPASQTVNITNGGNGTLSGLTKTFPNGTPTWLSVTLNQSIAPAVLTVKPSMSNPFGGSFAPGTYTTRIAISSTVASNSPQYIDVTFTITAPSSITVYASSDNSVGSSSLDSQVANTVYSNDYLGVGVNYAWLIFGGYNSFITASALKFNVQSQIAGRTISSAKLRLYVQALRGDFTITPKIKVGAIAINWNSSTLTYNWWINNLLVYNQGQVLVNAPSNSVLPLEVDITTIVQNWASGTFNNYGLSLTPDNHSYPGNSSLQTTFFQSTDQGKYDSVSKRPQLIIQFE